MKYQKQALIDACDLALQQDETRWHEQRAKHLEEHANQVSIWMARYGEQWAAAGLAVRKAIREGTPVTSAMLPCDRRYGSHIALFAASRSFTGSYQPPVELTFLRRILDVVADDIVTTTALEKLGVSVRTMRDAAWHMAVGSAKE